MQVSAKDPFMNKPKATWQGFHKPVASTEEIMESLEPYETRRQTDGFNLIRFQDQEERYYRDEQEAQQLASQNLN